jgi:hypothetical protein
MMTVNKPDPCSIGPNTIGGSFAPSIPRGVEFRASAFAKVTDAKLVGEGSGRLALLFCNEETYVSVPCPTGGGAAIDVVPPVRLHGKPPSPFYRLGGADLEALVRVLAHAKLVDNRDRAVFLVAKKALQEIAEL